MLLPDKVTLARLLAHYREQERLVLANPHVPSLRRTFEDTAYTLCVLMGERTAHRAIRAAERYLGGAALRPAPGPTAGSLTSGGPGT
ncbi:DUF5133 domain-containing protein [Streptomyces sp. NPDC001691]|uniref:DUF5133 domain-containing protein n=1 Tax=unclassified Streptomyces TaxID=2593676 RepID=UPI000DEB9A42|nr:DUF5133 domain-containing protein [Streptomyces sp. SDr-06]RCH67855.1 DUF5133 domain-containing protein [Streptomyces sp. SDr-06]